MGPPPPREAVPRVKRRRLQRAQAPAATPGGVSLSTGASRRGTVLVVEDDPDSLEMLRRMLEALGVRAVPAPDGEVALRLLSDPAPDLVLCDLMLPVVDGFRFVARLRADSRWR